MVTMKASQVLGNHELIRAFQALQQCPVPYATAKQIMGLAMEMDKKVKELEATRLEIVEKYSNKDSEGKPIVKDGTYDIIGKEKEVNEELMALFNQEIEIMQPKLDAKVLNHARLTPAGWDALEPFISQGGRELTIVG